MDDQLPAPLTPPGCDLRDFPRMALDIPRLRRSKSWLRAKRNPALGFYMINLWTASWHEVPAASLDDDDDVLADMAMCDPGQWEDVRGQLRDSWIKCSDGRLYHPVVASIALEAWQAKVAQRNRTSAATEARKVKRQKEKERKRIARQRDVQRDVDRHEQRDVHDIDNVASTLRPPKGEGELLSTSSSNTREVSYSDPEQLAWVNHLEKVLGKPWTDFGPLKWAAFPEIVLGWRRDGFNLETEVAAVIAAVMQQRAGKAPETPKYLDVTIRNRRAERAARVASAMPDTASPDPDAHWHVKLKFWREKRLWDHAAGAPPSDPRTPVPAHLLTPEDRQATLSTEAA